LTSAELARRVDEQAATEARVAALHQITAAVTSTLDLHAVLKVLMEKMDIFLPYSAIQVWLMNAESGVLERAACRNLDEAEWKRRQLKNTPALVKEAMDSRAPVVVRNVQTDARTLDPAFYRNQGIVSYLGLPLVVKDEVLGVLVTLTRQEHQFSPAEIEFLSTVAGQAAIGIHNSQLYEQTTKQAAELERAYKELKNKEEIQSLLKDLNQDITRLDIDSLFRNLTEKVREILRVDISDVRVLVEGKWKLTGITGIDPNLLKSGRSGTGRGPAGWIQQHRQPLVIPDLAHTEVPVGSTMKSLGIHGYVGVPLFSRGGEVIGVLRGLSYQPRDFTQEEVELLQLLASGSGVALENAKLLDEIKCQAVALERSNEAKDELMQVMARQKEELARLNAGLQSEIAEHTKARAEIAAKNRDLETLLYVTSHDLREPLRAIENFSRIINDRYGERLDEKGQDFLRRVIQGSQRLTQLLDDILMLSRSQRMGAPTEAVAGETIVREALKRLEGKVSATNAQVHVASEFGGLRVDKTWATQAVYNLLVNALKFTRDGAAPDVEIAPYSPEGSGVVGIAVRDRGPGVSPEHAERIFQLFQRAVGREVEGTGAGLAIVRQIAERHGGNAWVEPRAGGGSQFVITFGQSKGVQGGSSNEY
jgi:signal transduction histidine kinase